MDQLSSRHTEKTLTQDRAQRATFHQTCLSTGGSHRFAASGVYITLQVVLLTVAKVSSGQTSERGCDVSCCLRYLTGIFTALASNPGGGFHLSSPNNSTRICTTYSGHCERSQCTTFILAPVNYMETPIIQAQGMKIRNVGIPFGLHGLCCCLGGVWDNVLLLICCLALACI